MSVVKAHPKMVAAARLVRMQAPIFSSLAISALLAPSDVHFAVHQVLG